MLRFARVAAALASVALAPGGSNFSWYRVDNPQPGTCVREPYGVIPNFANPDAQQAIRAELAQMISSRQRRLRIGIFHGHGFNTGTVMDSTGGDLSPENRRNLSDLLTAAKAAGFTQVEVAFHPEGPAVREWTRWRQDLYDENWSLIRNLRPLIRAAGIPYWLDLSNEAIPTAQQPLVLRYARTLWADYASTFGRADTVGFSVIGDPAHVGEIPAVYRGKPPYVFDIHFYGGTSGLNELGLFRASDRTMTRLGLRQPWIIGEAFYDDAEAARELSAAIAGSSRPVYYLTQWPLTRGSACADVDVPAPTSFAAYASAGFASAARPRPVLLSRTLHADGRDRVALRIACENSATTCTGTARLRVGKRLLAPRAFAATPPRSIMLRLRWPRGQRPRTAAVTLSVKSLDTATVVKRTFSAAVR
jgi:hypothetical protein